MSIDDKPKIIFPKNIVPFLMLVATIIIALANYFTYREMTKDYRARTRPYIQIDFNPNEERVYLQNYGQIFAKNTSSEIYAFRNNEWKNVGTVKNMALMPNERRSVDYGYKKIEVSSSTVEQIGKIKEMRQILEEKSKPVEEIKIKVTYQGVDGKEFHTSRRFSCAYPNQGPGIFAVSYASQDDIVD